jgi:hypothetical protein
MRERPLRTLRVGREAIIVAAVVIGVSETISVVRLQITLIKTAEKIGMVAGDITGAQSGAKGGNGRALL